MSSPARASYQRKLAAMATGQASKAPGAPPMPQDGPVATEYQMLLAALGEDLRQLKQIQSVERKIEAKAKMIARYLPWVEGALANENPVQDEIVSTMLIWSIDLADWPLALRLAEHVITHGLAMPERYTRQPAVVVADEFAEAGLKDPATIDLASLQQASRLTADADMPDQARAKLEKAQGLAFQAQAATFDPTVESAPAGGKPALLAAAMEHFKRALSLDKTSGVKKIIERVEGELKKLAPAATG